MGGAGARGLVARRPFPHRGGSRFFRPLPGAVPGAFPGPWAWLQGGPPWNGGGRPDELCLPFKSGVVGFLESLNCFSL